MINILFWIGIFVSGVVFAALFRNTIAYWLWRLTGGVRRLEKEHGLKLPQLLGLSNPHPITVETGIATLMPTPNFDGKSSVRLPLSDKVTLIRDTSNSVVEDKVGFFPLHVRCRKVFLVNPRQVSHGCCRKYSLSRAVFLMKSIGADPWCGGGIKSFWPPFFQGMKENFLLQRTLREQTIQAFVSEDKDGRNYSAYNYNEEGAHGYLSLFIGDEAAIDSYAREYNKKLRPIQVSFV